MPIPLDNVAKLLQCEIQDPLWWEAIEKEINGLDEQGVYIHNLTRDQLREMGKIPDMPIVPPRMLLTVKVDSEGNLQNVKRDRVCPDIKALLSCRTFTTLLWLRQVQDYIQPDCYSA